MIAHEFSEANDRCIHCGTPRDLHDKMAQPCVPRWSTEPLRPEPTRREYALEDYDTIGKRLAELAEERTAAMNEPSKD